LGIFVDERNTGENDEFVGLADLDVRATRSDIQIESANRLNLFCHLFCAIITGPTK
jgi:hypothetical protein